MYNNGSITALVVVRTNTPFAPIIGETSTNDVIPLYCPITSGTSGALSVFVRNNTATPLNWSNDAISRIMTGVFNNTYKSVSVQDNGSSFVGTNGNTVSTPLNYSRTVNVGTPPPTNTFCVGALVRPTTGSFMTGDLSEIIIHSVVLPDELRDGIKATATTYFGL
jgi:hypothetical protein